jgi:LmbE family N-acetylglucosaminyl deacetylase
MTVKEQKARVLGIGAHPDDLEFIAGGTLANFVAAGHSVFMATTTNGDQGHFVIMPEELAAVRNAEALAAAKVIGASYECLGFHDEYLTTGIEERDRVVDLLRRVQPDLIITHPPNDYHPDHRATFELVFAASFVATVPHVRAGTAAPLKAVPQIFCCPAVGSFDSQPEYYIDISNSIERKIAALAKHESQIVWLKEHDNFDLLEVARANAASCGFACGVKFAEAFSRVHRYPGIKAQPLLPF